MYNNMLKECVIVERKSKKLNIEIVISICLITLFIAIKFSPLPIIIMDMVETSKSMNDEEMNNYFNENKNDFENANKTLKKYPYIEYFQKDSSNIEGVYEYKTKNNIYIESDQKLTNEILTEIDNGEITTIMKKMKFKEIYNSELLIQFMQNSLLSDASGILYIPDITKFNNENCNAEQYDIKQIDNGWYIFHEK